MLRLTRENWDRFETHNKKTTIRLHQLKPGIHACGSGSPQWGNWKKWGDVHVHPWIKKCRVDQLTLEDAKRDGFDSLCELLLELGRLNKSIKADDIVYIHPLEKVKYAGE